MFPRVTASNLPRFYDQPVPSFMALQSDFCPDITPRNNDVRRPSFFQLQTFVIQKTSPPSPCFFSAGLSLFAFLSFNKWWWWCRVDGDTVNKKKTYFVFAGKKRSETDFLLLDIQPLLLQTSLAAGESTPSVTPLHLHRKTLAGLPALSGEPKGLTRRLASLRRYIPFFWGNGEVFFLNQNMLRVQQHVGWKYDAFQRIKLQTASSGESQSVTGRIPTQQTPRYGQILGIQPRLPKINKTTDQPQGSSTKNLSNLSSVVRGSHG